LPTKTGLLPRTVGVSQQWQDNQADRPRPAGISEHCSQDAAVGADVL
jgi:hypothetical protein